MYLKWHYFFWKINQQIVKWNFSQYKISFALCFLRTTIQLGAVTLELFVYSLGSTSSRWSQSDPIEWIRSFCVVSKTLFSPALKEILWISKKRFQHSTTKVYVNLHLRVRCFALTCTISPEITRSRRTVWGSPTSGRLFTRSTRLGITLDFFFEVMFRSRCRVSRSHHPELFWWPFEAYIDRWWSCCWWPDVGGNLVSFIGSVRGTCDLWFCVQESPNIHPGRHSFVVARGVAHRPR